MSDADPAPRSHLSPIWRLAGIAAVLVVIGAGYSAYSKGILSFGPSVTHLDREDGLDLELSAERLGRAQDALSAAQREVARQEATRKVIVDRIVAKYRLRPEVDKIGDAAGGYQIQRGAAPDAGVAARSGAK